MVKTIIFTLFMYYLGMLGGYILTKVWSKREPLTEQEEK